MNQSGSPIIILGDILSLIRTDDNGNIQYNNKNLLDTDSQAALVAANLIIKTTRRAIADAAGALNQADHLIAYTSLTATRAFTLGAASDFAGRHFVLKDESGQVGSNANPITIIGTVDGASNPSAIAANYGKYKFYSNGTAWFTE